MPPTKSVAFVKRIGGHVAGAGQPRLVTLGDRRAAEGDGRALRPVGDLARRDRRRAAAAAVDRQHPQCLGPHADHGAPAPPGHKR